MNKYNDKLTIPNNNYERFKYKNTIEKLLKGSEIKEYFKQREIKNNLLKNYKFFDITSNKKINYKQTKLNLKIVKTKKSKKLLVNEQNKVVLPYNIYETKVNSLFT